MKLISFHPVGPASSFNLSLLHTHQLVSLPADGGLRLQDTCVIIVYDALADDLIKFNKVHQPLK